MALDKTRSKGSPNNFTGGELALQTQLHITAQEPGTLSKKQVLGSLPPDDEGEGFRVSNEEGRQEENVVHDPWIPPSVREQNGFL